MGDMQNHKNIMSKVSSALSVIKGKYKDDMKTITETSKSINKVLENTMDSIVEGEIPENLDEMEDPTKAKISYTEKCKVDAPNPKYGIYGTGFVRNLIRGFRGKKTIPKTIQIDGERNVTKEFPDYIQFITDHYNKNSTNLELCLTAGRSEIESGRSKMDELDNLQTDILDEFETIRKELDEKRENFDNLKRKYDDFIESNKDEQINGYEKEKLNYESTLRNLRTDIGMLEGDKAASERIKHQIENTKNAYDVVLHTIEKQLGAGEEVYKTMEITQGTLAVTTGAHMSSAALGQTIDRCINTHHETSKQVSGLVVVGAAYYAHVESMMGILDKPFVNPDAIEAAWSLLDDAETVRRNRLGYTPNENQIEEAKVIEQK